jgi:hypothetical protein
MKKLVFILKSQGERSVHKYISKDANGNYVYENSEHKISHMKELGLSKDSEGFYVHGGKRITKDHNKAVEYAERQKGTKGAVALSNPADKANKLPVVGDKIRIKPNSTSNLKGMSVDVKSYDKKTNRFVVEFEDNGKKRTAEINPEHIEYDVKKSEFSMSNYDFFKSLLSDEIKLDLIKSEKKEYLDLIKNEKINLFK